MIKMGGPMPMRGRPMTSGSAPNTKLNLKNVSQGKTYSNNAYPASNAFVAGGGKFTHT
jgi:hypothetical protein